MTRHPFDPFSFIAGLVLAGIAAVALTDSIAVRPLVHGGEWILPVVLVVVGLTVLLSVGRRRDDGSTDADVRPTDP